MEMWVFGISSGEKLLGSDECLLGGHGRHWILDAKKGSKEGLREIRLMRRNLMRSCFVHVTNLVSVVYCSNEQQGPPNLANIPSRYMGSHSPFSTTWIHVNQSQIKIVLLVPIGHGHLVVHHRKRCRSWFPYLHHNPAIQMIAFWCNIRWPWKLLFLVVSCNDGRQLINSLKSFIPDASGCILGGHWWQVESSRDRC